MSTDDPEPTPDTDTDKAPTTQNAKEKLQEVDGAFSKLGILAVDLVKIGTHLEMLLHMVLLQIAGSRSIDKAASWLLVGIGATVALMVSNINTIIINVGPAGYKGLLIILLIAAVVGLIEKVAAIYFQSSVETLDQSLEKLRTLAESFEGHKKTMIEKMELNDSLDLPDVDLGEVFKKYKSLLPDIKPPWLRRVIHGELKDDRDFNQFFRIVLAAYTIQRIAFAGEYFTAFFFVIFLVWIV
jgi:hypothetical protein